MFSNLVLTRFQNSPPARIHWKTAWNYVLKNWSTHSPTKRLIFFELWSIQEYHCKLQEQLSTFPTSIRYIISPFSCPNASDRHKTNPITAAAVSSPTRFIIRPMKYWNIYHIPSTIVIVAFRIMSISVSFVHWNNVIFINAFSVIVFRFCRILFIIVYLERNVCSDSDYFLVVIIFVGYSCLFFTASRFLIWIGETNCYQKSRNGCTCSMGIPTDFFPLDVSTITRTPWILGDISPLDSAALSVDSKSSLGDTFEASPIK